jgi:uncharacterized protein YndB with AHSA1/START domain
MPSAERTIAIRRPVEQVFRFLADGRTATQWRWSVIEVSKASGDGVGAVYRQVVRGPGGRPVDADYEITALEPAQRIAFRAIAGAVRPEGEYLLEAMGEATILTFRLAAALPWWRRLVLGRLVQSSMEAEMRSLDALQELLER